MLTSRLAKPGDALTSADRARADWLRLTYYPYFRLQLDAQFLADLLADEFDQFQGILGRTVPEVYQVVGVHRRDLDPAHTRAFQAGRLYHAAWEISLGALERGATARPVR